MLTLHTMKRSGKYTVVEPKNDHGAMTIREHPRNGTYHVVEYDGEDVERALDGVGCGSVVHLELRRTGRRGNAWCAEAAKPVEKSP